MARNRRELKMALRVLITVMTAILEMLENSDNCPEEVAMIGKDGDR